MDTQAHDILVKALCAVLDETEKCEVIQTHISTIILHGDLVYKLKRPVDFGFLDYSTLERRHRFILEEIRINKRYAPELYLGIVPITGSVHAPRLDGEGRVLEYALKMRRFDQAEQLDHIVERGALAIEMMDTMASVIASSHKMAPSVETDSGFGGPERVIRPMMENFELLEQMMQTHGLELDLAPLQAWVHETSERLAPSMRRRKQAGFIRECHGDLHLHNMALHEGKLIMFDAIEFNPFLDHIDVISDLAFLLMDLEHRGMKRYSNRLLDRYLASTGDYESLELLSFYKSYRAMVRAKVAALSITESMSAEVRSSLVAEVEAYVRLATSYMRQETPLLSITHGYSGSGKSTFASMMVEEHGMIRIRSDVERMRLFDDTKENIYTDTATRTTYARLASIAKSVYKSGYRVILDATFLKQWQRELVLELAVKLGATYTIFDLECAMSLMQERVQHRLDEGSDVSEADTEVLAIQRQSAEMLEEDEHSDRVRIDCTTLQTMRAGVDAWGLRSP